MKKTALLTAALMMMGTSAVMAAPINQMATHETAVGVGTKESYVENKVTNKATVGFQYANRDEYGDHKDAYLQYDVVGSEVKLIGGYRWNLPGDKNQAFGGIALRTPKVMGFDAYASYVAGKDFNETQVGINKNLLLNVDLNINYHNFKPEDGHRENGIGAGVTVKF